MSNKIIYPILIIIFSILIIYAILNKRRSNKLNDNIEKFLNYTPVDISNENLSNNNIDNSIITKDFANGNWTTPWTKIINNRIINLMNINVKNLMHNNILSQNYGTINLLDVNYTITYILNENIVAKSNNNTSLHIKFYNIFSKESETVPEMNGTITSIVKMYNANQIAEDFYSYKIHDITNMEYVNRLLQTQNSYVKKPAEVFDLKTYKAIINNYQYSSNFLSMTYATNNNTILNKIKSSYFDGIRYSIQRIFQSPTGNKITTQMSSIIILPGYQGNNIGSFIILKPFKFDFDVMGLDSYFQPYATLVYFYKMTNISTSFSFSDTNLNNTSNSTFKLKNNANNMYKSNVQYNNLNSITGTNTSTYQLISVGSFSTTDINQEVRVPFSNVYNLF